MNLGTHTDAVKFYSRYSLEVLKENGCNMLLKMDLKYIMCTDIHPQVSYSELHKYLGSGTHNMALSILDLFNESKLLLYCCFKALLKPY